jgi:hypothetical protein
MRQPWLSLPCAAFLLAAACQPAGSLGSSSGSIVGPSGFVPGAKVHEMPLVGMGIRPDVAVPVGTRLLYNGGPVISNVNVIQVLYGAGAYAPEVAGSTMGSFYQQLTNSPIVDWLSEYNTTVPDQNGNPGTNQTIGRGGFARQVQIAPSAPNSGATVSDGQIQAELATQIAKGALPASSANTLYMVNVPKGVQVLEGANTSCQDFCAFHGSFQYQGSAVYYGVLPDMSAGSGCDMGCGTTSVPFDNLTMVAMHELVEAVTDSDVGRNNLAWYDGQNGEIADICSSRGGFLTGTDGVTYAVQQLYSNAVGDCILSKAANPADFTLTVSPQSLALTAGSHATLQVSTSALGASGSPISLSLSGLPPGVTGTFDVASLSPGSTSNLTLTAASSAATVTFSLNVTGTDGSGGQTASAGIGVIPAGSVDTVVNGGFETGNLTGWSTVGVAAVTAGGQSGRYGLMLGSFNATLGDNSAAQTFTAPQGASHLSFWYQMNCRDLVANDWATANLADNTSGSSRTVLPPTCQNDGWVEVTAQVIAGHSYTLTLTNHDDGSDVDPTYTLFDEAHLQ